MSYKVKVKDVVLTFCTTKNMFTSKKNQLIENSIIHRHICLSTKLSNVSQLFKHSALTAEHLIIFSVANSPGTLSMRRMLRNKNVSVFIFILTYYFNDTACEGCVCKLYDPCYCCKKTSYSETGLLAVAYESPETRSFCCDSSTLIYKLIQICNYNTIMINEHAHTSESAFATEYFIS
ncbi:hypothetical protein AGLY_002182 [Aphis glycines]|uniref:Uncharacterized protein n=1 Tax=Aphis glycines TaxID=307491 RepID=A0A6G0U524_APHGL|nr:hypothetical protein AGLY_002182 [Aphis glycines]